MVKIKRKVEMTQEEYAKYMIDKYGVSGFESELINDNIIDAPKRFTLAFELNPVPKSDLLNGSFRNGKFTIEVEEEITEDTEIPKLMTTFKKTCLEGGIGYQRVRIDENYPIKLMLNKAEAHREPVETLHIVNDDGTHTLIWRDGKLVE
ncbi:hypothetical protein NGH74_08520 [Staphylococcus pseudoxylosus]|uniref:hypothetical protein n=1 Tax=Staphylococcus pseudoxylosus TaxID=2282419 RepID=UPI002DB99DFC|nr:hypothetical protein [Staphylococcus pseudoxylosus]MEB8087217.1 hypothetical protein [Staphylococcus pseudoxylosus]